MQNVRKTCGRIRGKNTSFLCCENKRTWCGKGHSLKTLVPRAKLRTQQSDSTVNRWEDVFSIANGPPCVFKDRNSVEGPAHNMYQFNIIALSFTFLTYLPNFEEMWLRLKKSRSSPDADKKGEPWQSICRLMPRRCTVAKFTKKIRDNFSNVWVDKWRPHGPDAGHRNTEPAIKPNLSTVPRILRVQLQYDNH